MKIYKYLGLSLMAVVLAGCQNEVIVSEQQDSLFTLRANMNGYSNDSRAQIGLGCQDEAVEYFYWNAKDQFSLIEYTSQGKVDHVFTISDSYSNDAKYHEAEFTSPTALTKQSNFVAFYPLVDERENGDFYFGIVNTLKDNTESSWLGYFKNNLFMQSTGVTSQNGLEFNQMCNLIRITYTNDTKTDRNINRIAVDGSWTYGLLMDAKMYPYTEYLDDHEYGIEFTDGATIEAGKSEDFYILYFPTDVYIKGENPDLIRQPMSKISVYWGEHNSMETVAYPFGDTRPDFNASAGKRYWFNVTETANGLEWTNHMNEEDDDTVYPTVPEGSILIKDKGFSEALYNILDKTKVRLEDGYAIIDKEYANSYRGTFNLNEQNTTNQIKSLNGIEHFKNLSHLFASNLGLTTCDLSQNTNLQIVNLANYSFNVGKMTSIDLGSNSCLTELNVSSNNLTELNLEEVPNLQYLFCSSNPNLKSLTLSSQCVNLQEIDVSFTGITSLTIPNPSVLKGLGVSNVDIPINNWNEFKSLKHVDCSGRDATFVAGIPDQIKGNLKDFNCGDCGLTSLNLFPFKSLVGLFCGGNQLTKLDLSHLSELRSLGCENNRLTHLDLSATNVLEDLTCGYQTNGEVDDNEKPIYITLKLVLSSAMQERWNNVWINEYEDEMQAWKDGWSHKDKEGTIYVELDTTGNSNGNSVGGSDFTYGENNIW